MGGGAGADRDMGDATDGEVDNWGKGDRGMDGGGLASCRGRSDVTPHGREEGDGDGGQSNGE